MPGHGEIRKAQVRGYRTVVDTSTQDRKLHEVVPAIQVVVGQSIMMQPCNRFGLHARNEGIVIGLVHMQAGKPEIPHCHGGPEQRQSQPYSAGLEAGAPGYRECGKSFTHGMWRGWHAQAAADVLVGSVVASTKTTCRIRSIIGPGRIRELRKA